MKQFIITPSMGKRLIAKGMTQHPRLCHAMKHGRIVIIAGSTNGYIAEEILTEIGEVDAFTRVGFRRGTVVPPDFTGIADTKLQGDVILTGGQWRQEDRGKTIFDVASNLVAGDVVLKGGNAVNIQSGQAAVYIGHPQAGTIGAVLPGVFGRRVQLIVPIGLEKRVFEDLALLAASVNDPQAEGPRLLPMPGEIFTELNAIATLTGAKARLVAGGGIYGAEGCIWIGVEGQAEQIRQAEKIIESLADEPPCQV